MSNILSETQNQVLTLTINRPEKLNALNRETISELGSALDEAMNNKDVRVIIITGSGNKAFVAGADISEFASFNNQEGKDLARNGQQELFDLIENSTKPVIAAVNGFALGGGLELAMSCHVRVASENARMGLPEVSLGVIPGYGGTQRLPQLVGRGKANEMIFTAGMMKADEALSYGLVNYVVPQEELLTKAQEIANKILPNSPKAIEKAIIAVNAGYHSDTNGFDTEIKEFGNCFGTEDFKEGTSAFLNKTKPNFAGN